MAQRKPKFHIFALLVVVFLIILVLASFSFTIAFSARADNGKGLLQNPVYGSVPLVKEFRKIYWYGLIGVRAHRILLRKASLTTVFSRVCFHAFYMPLDG